MKRLIRAAAFAGLLVAACSTAGTNLAKQAAVESGPYLAAGDFQKAIDPYKAAFKRNPRHRGLTANYVRTVEEIRRMADRAMGRQDYDAAGRIYRILLNNYADFKTLAAALTFTKPYLEASLRYCRIALVDTQSRLELKAGNPAKALELSSALLKEYPGGSGAAANHLKLVQETKAAADKALTEKDFVQAGKVYALLLKSLASFEALKPAVAFTTTDLTEAIAVCRDYLTKAGLAEYRKGNLAKSIEIWEGLLSFDPDNTEIKKAVETAKTQLNEIIKKKWPSLFSGRAGPRCEASLVREARPSAEAAR